MSENFSKGDRVAGTTLDGREVFGTYQGNHRDWDIDEGCSVIFEASGYPTAQHVVDSETVRSVSEWNISDR